VKYFVGVHLAPPKCAPASHLQVAGNAPCRQLDQRKRLHRSAFKQRRGADPPISDLKQRTVRKQRSLEEDRVARSSPMVRDKPPEWLATRRSSRGSNPRAESPTGRQISSLCTAAADQGTNEITCATRWTRCPPESYLRAENFSGEEHLAICCP